MVNPIAFAAPQAWSANADFAPLAQLGNIYGKAQQDTVNKAAFAEFQRTGDPRALIASGDMNLARLGISSQQDARDYKFRVDEAQRGQSNWQKSFDKPPTNYTADPDREGGYKAIPGSAADVDEQLRQDALKKEADRKRRHTDAVSNGLQPGSPEYNQFMITGHYTDRTPPNYVPDPTKPGAVQPQAGGPADPQEQLRVAGLKREQERILRQKDAEIAGLKPGTPEYQHFMATGTYTAPKAGQLTEKGADKISERGTSYEDFTRLKSDFKDEFGGYKTGFAADVGLGIASKLNIGNVEGANWWRDYQEKKNVIRNKLFGSALTAQEKSEFDKGNIDPSLSPGVIKENLRKQHEAARKAAVKLVNYHISAGHSLEQIEAALGFPVADLVKPAEPTPPPPPAKTAPSKEPTTLSDWLKKSFSSGGG